MIYTCEKCKHHETEVCDECSNRDGDMECSCHINPPCNFCGNLKYEEIEDEEDTHDPDNER
jgi:hypothetical protein